MGSGVASPAFVEPCRRAGRIARDSVRRWMMDQRWRFAWYADAVEREEHLLVGPVEAVVPGAGRGVDLDPVDPEERFDLSSGVLDDRPRMTVHRQLSSSSRSTMPAWDATLGTTSSICSARWRAGAPTGSGAPRSVAHVPVPRDHVASRIGIRCPRSGDVGRRWNGVGPEECLVSRARRPPWCDAAGMGCGRRASAARS